MTSIPTRAGVYWAVHKRNGTGMAMVEGTPPFMSIRFWAELTNLSFRDDHVTPQDIAEWGREVEPPDGLGWRTALRKEPCRD